MWWVSHGGEEGLEDKETVERDDPVKKDYAPMRKKQVKQD